MDRRYGQAKGAVPSSRRGEALVHQYLQRARAQNWHAQRYGGSTGGAKSVDPMTGGNVLAERSRQMGEAREIFREEGSGALGARASLREARQLPEDLY